MHTIKRLEWIYEIMKGNTFNKKNVYVYVYVGGQKEETIKYIKHIKK